MRQGDLSVSPSQAIAARGNAHLLGLVGSPISQSAAPAMHEAAAQALGLRCFYHLIDIPGLDRAGLQATMDGVRRLGFSGVNVTFPYKEAVVPLLDRLSPAAAGMGAVNTVVVEGGALVGYNTDSTGFASAFREVFGPKPEGPVALVGAGGAGRAIAFAFAALGAPALRLYDSDRAKAKALADALGGQIAVTLCDDVAGALKGACGAVNAKPEGMLTSRENPIHPDLLSPDVWIADAVYTPLWTPLLLAAEAKGCRVMTGRELAIWQAVDAFKLFTGRDPSAQAIGAAFDQVMARRAAAA